MGVPDHLTRLLRNLYAGQEATEPHTEQQTGLELGKEYGKAIVTLLSPCLFNFCAEYIIKMLGWMNHNLESRLPGEISTASDMQIIRL